MKFELFNIVLGLSESSSTPLKWGDVKEDVKDLLILK